MTVRFYQGRRKVYQVVTNNINAAIAMADNFLSGEWTRYKIF